jgi:hypothetical protein
MPPSDARLGAGARAKAKRIPPQPGYVRLGRHYLAISFIYTTLITILALGYVAVLVVYPAAMAAYYANQAQPTFRLDSPYLASYSGRVRLLESNGELLYEGDINQTVIDGVGLLYAKGVLRYSGNFVAGAYGGEGKLYNADGSLIYEGMFLDNHYEGKGWLYEGGKLRYNGDFVAGIYEGQGRLYEDGKLLYTGAFVGGVYEGQGKLYEDDTLLYAGDFVAGAYEGQGKLYAGTSLLYEGQFVAGVFNGEGIEYNPETGYRVFAGAFLDGERTANGTLYDDEGREVVEVPGFINSATYLDRPYEEVMIEWIRAGRVYTEADIEKRRLVAEDATGLLLAFNLDDEGKPNIVSEIYLTGKSNYGSFVVGAQIGPGKHTEPEAGAVEQYSLVLSNSIWGRDLVLSDLVFRDCSVDKLKLRVFYLPVMVEVPKDASGANGAGGGTGGTGGGTGSGGGGGTGSSGTGSSGTGSGGGGSNGAPVTPDSTTPTLQPDPAAGGTIVFIKISREGA